MKHVLVVCDDEELRRVVMDPLRVAGIDVVQIPAARAPSLASPRRSGATPQGAVRFDATIVELSSLTEVAVEAPREAEADNESGIVLDPASRSVQVRGQRVQLGVLHFAIITALLAGRGQPVSRTQLLTDAWGISPHAQTNCVAMELSRLRAKLTPYGIRIESIRGDGYRVVVSGAENDEDCDGCQPAKRRRIARLLSRC